MKYYVCISNKLFVLQNEVTTPISCVHVTKLIPDHHISSGMYLLAASHSDNVAGDGQDNMEHDDAGDGGPGQPPGQHHQGLH